MSNAANAVKAIRNTNKKKEADNAPFRAIVSGTSGNLTYIQRLAASVPDAEPYGKTTADTFIAGDEVLCLPVNGKPVILGKVRR